MGRYNENTIAPTATGSLGRFERAQIKESATPAPKIEKIVNTLPNPKTAIINADNARLQKESESANSFWGLAKNTIKGIIPTLMNKENNELFRDTIIGLPKAGVEVTKNLYHGIKDPIINPNEAQKKYEETYFPEQPKNLLATVTKPGQTAAKYITRFLSPGLQPLGEDLAEIKAVNEKGGIADRVASGEIPVEVLNEFAVLQKNAPQIVGDVAQAVLTAYAGGQAENVLNKSLQATFRESLKRGVVTGLETGEIFGLSQALSSGSANPLEILATIGTSGAAGGILGAITSGVIPVSKEVLAKVKEAKTLYDSLTPSEKQAGFAKNPFIKNKELELIGDHVNESGISKDKFIEGLEKLDTPETKNLKEMIKKEGLTPDQFYDAVKSDITPDRLNTLREEIGATNPTLKEIPRVSKELQSKFNEFKNLPKDYRIVNPKEIISTGLKASDDIIKITGITNDEVSFTHQSLKHLSEKGDIGQKIIDKIPEIINSPDQIRKGGAQDRYLISKDLPGTVKQKPHTITLEVTEKDGHIIVTGFEGRSKYLENFDLLWRAADSPSQQGSPQGGSSRFSALREDRNPQSHNSKQKTTKTPEPQPRTAGNAGRYTLEQESKQTKQTPKEGGKEKPAQSDKKSSSKDTITQKDRIDKYVKEQIKKRESAKTSGVKGARVKIKNFLANAKKKLVDFAAPIEDILYDTLKKNKMKLDPKQDIHNQIDMVLRSPTLAGEFAREHGIAQVIKDVPNVDYLDQYLIAKHALELEAKGITTGRDIAKDTALIESLKGEYEPFAKKISDYSRKLLDYSVESGLISNELATILKEKYPDYVPFNRVFNELEKAGQFEGDARGVASLSKQTIVKKIEGSTREVESPLESLLIKTTDAFKQGEKNKAAKLLASYKDLPENPFALRELEAGESSPHTISYLDNGEKRTFETTPEVAQAAKALNVQQLNILGKIFAFPVRVAKIGITGINLPFIASNIVKDQITAYINSNHGVKTSLMNPKNFIKSLFSAVSHDKLYREMVAEGGGGTSFDIARDQVPKTIKQIRSERSVPSRILYSAKNPSQLLRIVENIIGRSEELTRIQQYRGTKEVALKKGMSPENARAEATRAARENTVNFYRRGEWGQVLNSAFLYLNAGIQGTRTFLRNMKTKPIQTTAKIAIAGFTPLAIATAWNLNDPERRKAYEDIAEYEKEGNIIIVPPNPTKDANGKWNVIKIPISQEINNLMAIVRKPIEAAHGLDPVKFSDFAKALIGSIEPIQPDRGSILSTLTPQAIKPTIESAVNKNLFTNFPIVPDSMKNLPPDKQVKDNTSGTARTIGSLLGVSPLQAEAFIKGTFGGVGPQALHVVDQVLAGAGVIPKDQIGGQNVLDAITARFSKAAGGEIDNKAIEEIQDIIRQRAGEDFDLENEAEKKWEELKAMPKKDAADAFVKLMESDPKLAKEIGEIGADEKRGLTASDRFIKQLQVNNGERAKYIAKKLQVLGTNEEKGKLWEDYVSKGLISPSVASQIGSLLKKPELINTETPSGSSEKQRNIISLVTDYAKAYGTDPQNAFKAMFTSEKLGEVKGNLVELERFKGVDFDKQGGSEEYIKKEFEKLGIPWADRKNYNLEHITPVKAGGSTDADNLYVVDRATHDSYTPVDILASEAIKEGKLTREEITKIMKELKVNKTITIEEAKNQLRK